MEEMRWGRRETARARGIGRSWERGKELAVPLRQRKGRGRGWFGREGADKRAPLVGERKREGGKGG